ncbi:MAG TPA: hydroxymyristoyl-ACP dehydratase [Rhodanobacteraceae bacterium]|nr:hydroxymyristoyl-ACP dehydratase [Rhodanobacteraceae bacterium]
MTAVHVVTLRIAPGHPALPGHFPGEPLVPGVVLLERVAAALRDWRGVRMAGLDAKFMQPLRPGEEAAITLQDEGARTRFEVSRADGQTIARGMLTAAPKRA